MGRRGKFLAVLFALCAALPVKAQVFSEGVGEAFDVQTGELLYRELHSCSADGSRCTVDYRDSRDQRIAFKELDYSENLHGPALRMRDLLGDSEEALSFSDREDLVVDAGFDNYVRSRWDQLDSGEALVFPFQVVGVGRPLDMRAREGGELPCDAQSLCLKVEVDSWLIGLLADPIELSYSRDTRRLLRFVGMSNLRLDGEAPMVDIRYTYTD